MGWKAALTSLKWNLVKSNLPSTNALPSFSSATVVVLYYGSGIFAYMRPNSKTMSERDKVISLFYSVMTSMLNPIIYSLRNKDVKGALRKLAGR